MKKQIIVFLLSISCSLLSFGQKGYQIGDKAADFKLKATDGKYYSFKDFGKVKGYVVIFTCNHCPFSIAYQDRIIALQKEYKDKGIEIIAINPNDPKISPGDSYAKMIERVKEKNFNFTYLFDENQEVFPKYGATRTPQVYLLDKNKKVRYIGAIDDSTEAEDVQKNFLSDAINAYLNNEKIEPEITKAIGCSIKARR